ncbi:Pycsar system effector family protein [Paradesertivirga mongoliensis]|uniref:Pycsar system effector family protein n=1 Tax=Paradesertivirga mongoliensis TaxID=2100740 RepID=A0ABW4ZHB8_9SPHI|nr:Pycsar system effector family protein [Pedobacter mongoliensis]
MKNANPIIKSAEEYVFNLFKEKLPPDHVYHNYKHTFQTVKACKDLADAYNLTSRDLEILLLAAIFHDTGYIETYQGHEETSIRIFNEFINGDYPLEDIKKVEELILSTKAGAVPDGTLQEILHDADYINIGKKKFIQRAELLRIEWERLLNKTYSDLEWAEIQLNFLISTNFVTEEAIVKLDDQREANIRIQRERIELLRVEHEKLSAKLEKNNPDKPLKEGRGIETLYRSVYEYHINLSQIADNKANIMISINTIIVSLVITLFGSGYTFSGQNEFGSLRFVIPMAVLLVTSLLAVVFAILSSRPNVTTKERYELSKKDSSILFFGNFAQLQLREFVGRINELKYKKEELYDSMSVDIYHLGSVLVKKYRLLSWSYNIFMGGLVLCAVAFIIIMMFSYQS